MPDSICSNTLFGLGTIPALLLVGLGANFLNARFKRYLFRFSAILVILLGLYTLNKGWMKLHMPPEKLQQKMELMEEKPSEGCCKPAEVPAS